MGFTTRPHTTQADSHGIVAIVEQRERGKDAEREAKWPGCALLILMGKITLRKLRVEKIHGTPHLGWQELREISSSSGR